jgi:PAS domain S-box-containing protein
VTDDDLHGWLCQAIVDGAPETIIAADPEGRIRLWNAGAAAIVGYRADEVVQHSLDLVFRRRRERPGRPCELRRAAARTPL